MDKFCLIVFQSINLGVEHQFRFLFIGTQVSLLPCLNWWTFCNFDLVQIIEFPNLHSWNFHTTLQVQDQNCDLYACLYHAMMSGCQVRNLNSWFFYTYISLKKQPCLVGDWYLIWHSDTVHELSFNQWCCWFQEEAYSYESSKALIDKDVVQLHAPRWQSLRRVRIWCRMPMVPRRGLSRSRGSKNAVYVDYYWNI